MCDVGCRSDVANPHERIGGRFDVDQSSVGPHRVTYTLGIPRVDERKFQPEFFEHACKHACHTTVGILLAHDMIAGGEALDYGLDRSQTARKYDPVPPTFQSGHFSFQPLDRRVFDASVVVPLLRLRNVGLDVRRRLENRRDDSTRHRLWRLPAVYREACESGFPRRWLFHLVLGFGRSNRIYPRLGRRCHPREAPPTLFWSSRRPF